MAFTYCYNNDSRLYSIYANPEHVHFVASRSPRLSEQELATIVAYSSSKFITDNNLTRELFSWQKRISFLDFKIRCG